MEFNTEVPKHVLQSDAAAGPHKFWVPGCDGA
jgi:hypothetical protein